jgi:hypothetical protein
MFTEGRKTTISLQGACILVELTPLLPSSNCLNNKKKRKNLCVRGEGNYMHHCGSEVCWQKCKG